MGITPDTGRRSTVSTKILSVVLCQGAALMILSLTGCATSPCHHPDTGQIVSSEVAPTITLVKAVSPTEAQAAEGEEPHPSPRPLRPAGLTLDQAINTCLIADPRIRAGLEAINQANADLLTSWLKPNPELFTDIQLLPLTRPFTVDKQGGPPQQDLVIGYPIDWFLFGKRAAAMASTGLGVRVSEAEYANLIRERVRETAVAFYDVLEAWALVRLAMQDLENLQRVEAITRKAVEGGGRPAVELSRVRLDVLKSQQVQRDAVAALVIARARLRALLGRTDADPGFDVEGDLGASLTAEPLPADKAFALAERHRPDIHALHWQVARAEADIRLEDKRAYPEVTPQFGYTRQYQTKAIGFPDANSWSAAVSMTLPIFDRNQGNRARASSVLVQSGYELQAGLVELRAEIEQVVQEFRTAHQNASSVAQDQLKLAEQVRDSINKAYEAGGRTLLEVLDAQRNYRETYRLYITSRANYWRSLHRFNAAIGKQVLPSCSHDDSLEQAR